MRGHAITEREIARIRWLAKQTDSDGCWLLSISMISRQSGVGPKAISELFREAFVRETERLGWKQPDCPE